MKERVDFDPGWVSKYENSLNLNLIVPDGLWTFLGSVPTWFKAI